MADSREAHVWQAPEGHAEAIPVARAVAALIDRFGQEPPEVAIVLGSGLGPVKDLLDLEASAKFSEVGLPDSGVVGHSGELRIGRLGGRRVALLCGRVHLYEGHGPGVVVRAVRAMYGWGVRGLVLTNSAGSVHANLPPGSLVRVTDHINLMGANPLVGPAWGVRFPSPDPLYEGPLGQAVAAAAERVGVPMTAGVYAAMLGPSYESAAEIRMVRTIGGDLVGMSTVPEALAAIALGMDVAAVAVVSNFATGVTPEPVAHEMVTKVAGEAAVGLARVFEAALAG